MPAGDENKQLVVVIDVGHGLVPVKGKNPNGWDHGAVAQHVENGFKCYISEYEINLKNADLLRIELEKRGYKVILTTDERTETPDKGDNFSSRFEIAHKHKADLYISMHANSNPDKNMQGTWVYVAPPKTYRAKNGKYYKTSETVESETAAKNIINSLDKFDLTVEEKPKPLAEGHRGPLKDLNLGMKKRDRIPGVLIEAGFMTNKDDLLCLTDHDHCVVLTSAIADGIDKYFEKKQLAVTKNITNQLRQEADFITENIRFEIKKMEPLAIDTSKLSTVLPFPKTLRIPSGH